jgi:hypothetical protein
VWQWWRGAPIDGGGTGTPCPDGGIGIPITPITITMLSLETMYFFSKGGKQNIANEIVDEAKRLFGKQHDKMPLQNNSWVRNAPAMMQIIESTQLECHKAIGETRSEFQKPFGIERWPYFGRWTLALIVQKPDDAGRAPRWPGRRASLCFGRNAINSSILTHKFFKRTDKICAWLKLLYEAEADTQMRLKIKLAEKFFGCRKNNVN